VSGGRGSPSARIWERVSTLLFRLFPPSYQKRHGSAQQTLTRELLASEPDPVRRGRLARRVAIDALRTLPSAWAARALPRTFLRPRGGRATLLRPRGGPAHAAEAVWKDLGHSLRSFLRQPAMPLVAVASIALGIGFNTTLFSAVNALVLRPTPGVSEPERVVEIGRTNDGRGFDSFSYPDMLSLRDGVQALEHVAAWRMNPLSYGGEGAGERVNGMAVSAGYFEALGAMPALGRTFTAEEEAPGGPAVAVVGERFWRTRLAGDANVIGRPILVNRVPVTVVGVAPAGFAGHVPLVETDVWLPFTRLDIAEANVNLRLYEDRGIISHQVLARLTQGATPEQAGDEVAAVMANLADVYPDTNEGRGAAVARLGPIPGGGAAMVRGFLGLLMGFVVLILLVSAANVAGMLLARAAGREKEVAIRLAIGCGRARLVRQLLVETLVLALAGALAALLLADWATSLITTVQGAGFQLAVDLSPDRTVFAFALALAALMTLFVGIAPALQATRPDLLAALKTDGGSGARGMRARRTFVAVQLGVSVVLLASGGLLVRSLAQATRMSGGFDPAGVQMTSLDLSLDGYTSDRVGLFQEELLAATEAHPAIEAAALANDLPLDLSENGAPIWPEGFTGDAARGLGTDFNVVSAGYFETLRIPLLRGRDFGPSDRSGSAPVVIVSEALARRAWGDRDALGRTLRWSDTEDLPRTVVGVVGEVKNQTLGESEDGIVYLPLGQLPTPATHVLARGAAVDGELLGNTLLAVDPRLTLSPPQTLEAVTAVSLLPSRVAAGVTGLLGALALFLSSLGVYGVVAHTVAQRRREIGVRIALGASAPQVVRMIVAGAFRLALPGVIVGGLAALGVARLLRSLLLGISPADPATFGAVLAVLLATVALASGIPGRRASAVDPMEALKAE
jgi:predicted permease